jgi:hypothetical protein
MSNYASMTLRIKQIKDAGSAAYYVRERPRTQRCADREEA